MFKAKFETAYLQREIPEQALVAGDLVVGQVVKVTPKTEHIPAIITAAETAEEGNAFMAQSDMTLGYGHVPVEYQDYKYSPAIAENYDATDYGLGFFESDDDLPTDSTVVSDSDTAYVYNSTTDTFLEYVASVVGTTVTWATTDDTGIALPDVKPVAYFKIVNRDDVIIYEVN